MLLRGEVIHSKRQKEQLQNCHFDQKIIDKIDERFFISLVPPDKWLRFSIKKQTTSEMMTCQINDNSLNVKASIFCLVQSDQHFSILTTNDDSINISSHSLEAYDMNILAIQIEKNKPKIKNYTIRNNHNGCVISPKRKTTQ